MLNLINDLNNKRLLIKLIKMKIQTQPYFLDWQHLRSLIIPVLKGMWINGGGFISISPTNFQIMHYPVNIQIHIKIHYQRNSYTHTRITTENNGIISNVSWQGNGR